MGEKTKWINFFFKEFSFVINKIMSTVGTNLKEIDFKELNYFL